MGLEPKEDEKPKRGESTERGSLGEAIYWEDAINMKELKFKSQGSEIWKDNLVSINDDYCRERSAITDFYYYLRRYCQKDERVKLGTLLYDELMELEGFWEDE